MRGFLSLRRALWLVSCAAVFPGGVSAVEEKAAAEKTSVRVETIRTIGREGFHESLRDRLSGGADRQLPFRMAADSQGRILITEPFLSQVHVFDTHLGKRWKIHGDRAQRMVFPTYIAVDADDDIYVSEPLLMEVHVFSPDGHFLRAIGGEHLYIPFGVAVDQASRTLYVADHYRSEIQVYTLEGQFLRTISARGRGEGELWDPCDLVLHHGMIFVLDAGNARFQIFDAEGNPKGVWPFGNDRLPATFALDAAEHLYYIDLESRGMQISDAGGKPLAELGTQVRYGQPSWRGARPTFTSVVENPDGSVLALRPALQVEVVRVESPEAPSSGKSEEAAPPRSPK